MDVPGANLFEPPCPAFEQTPASGTEQAVRYPDLNLSNVNPMKNNIASLGWNAFFEQQLESHESLLIRARVISHFGSQVDVMTVDGDFSIPIQLFQHCDELAVGDWVLLEPATHRALRRLERETLIARRAAGQAAKVQLIAANIDTLFIVSSCNQDFNPSRIERYLAIAIESGALPVVLLTKSDLCDDVTVYRQQAERLRSGLIVETLNALDGSTVEVLSDWCRPGKTNALVRSSGVGKSTLANLLGSGSSVTAGIRESDAKGRHTTTARSMHAIQSGGWMIDTPGMRELQVFDCEQGIEDLFEDVVERASHCKYRNCRHEQDDGCALLAAVDSGDLELRRLRSFLKLQAEQERNSGSIAQRRDKERKLGKFYKSVIEHKRRKRDGDS